MVRTNTSSSYKYVTPRIATNYDGSYYARRTNGKTYIYKNNSLEEEGDLDTNDVTNDIESSYYSHMKFSSNGQTLAYTSEIDSRGVGKKLYYYDRDSNGNWTKNSLPMPSGTQVAHYSCFDMSSDGLTIVTQRHTDAVYNYEIVIFERGSTNQTFTESTTITPTLT